MNKSKFLKKSLAMLLALMLVLAMIPLSASADETGDYVKDLYVNGKRAALVGNELSVDIPTTEYIDITAGCHQWGHPVRRDRRPGSSSACAEQRSGRFDRGW